MPVSLRIKTSAASMLIKRVGAYARQRWPRKTMHALAKHGLELIEQNAPKGKTHELSGSFRIEHQTPARKVISTNCPYAIHVEEGVGPSPGRYVPVIEKRLIKPSKRNPDIGMHPGFEGRWYIKKSVDQLEQEAAEILEREVQL